MERTYISGGMVYDGTGKEPFCGDIVINGNTIEAVLPHSEDRFTGKNGRLILAQGLAVTPGFVDVHRHCDLAALTDPDFGRQELKQGITSVPAGNCGMSPAPSAGIMYVPECFNTREEWYGGILSGSLRGSGGNAAGACGRKTGIKLMSIRRQNHGLWGWPPAFLLYFL